MFRNSTNKKVIKYQYLCDAEYNNLKYILEERFHLVEVQNPQEADYVFIDPSFLQRGILFRQDIANIPIRIYLTIEALVPDFNLFDYALSFEEMSYRDRHFNNIYFIDFFDYTQIEKEDPNQTLKKKSKFCSFVVTNRNGHPNREAFFHLLNNYKKVDSLGKYLNNMGKPQEDSTKKTLRELFKHSIPLRAPYKFSIIFENAFHHGYTTEKIASAMCANSIPIYWGNPNISKYFNTESFINCHEYSNFEEVIEKIRYLDTNDAAYLEMLKKPWTTHKHLEQYKEHQKKLKSFLFNIFEQDVKNARRRGTGFWNKKYEKSKKKLWLINYINWKIRK